MRERAALRTVTRLLFLGSILLGMTLLISCKYTAKILPAAPSFLQACGVSSSQVNLAWRDNSKNEGGFIVERKEGPEGKWKKVLKTSPNLNKVTDTELSPGIIYYYRVLAFSSFGHSAYTNETAAKTLLNDTDRWYHTWGEAHTDYAYSLALDSGGGAYLAGGATGFGAGQGDALVLKYSTDGTPQWQRTWGGEKNEWAAPVAVGADGCAYVAGYTDSFGAGDYDCFLLKYSVDGDLLWQKSWGGAEYEGAQALCVDSDGNVYAAGDTESFCRGASDAFLLKYSPDGTLIWERTWGTDLRDGAMALCPGRDQTIILAGFASNTGTRTESGQGDLLLLEYSANGNLLSQETWGNGLDSKARRLFMDDDGSLLVAGATGSFDSGDYDALLMKFSLEGNLLWATAWGGPYWEAAQGVCTARDGSIYVAGLTNSFGAGWQDVLLLKYAPDGTLLRQRTWGGKDDEVAQCVCIDAEGALFIAGQAPDTFGSWYKHEGVYSSPLGTVTAVNGFSAVPTGTQGVPNGRQTHPRGGENLDGYCGDVLFMKLKASDV